MLFVSLSGRSHVLCPLEPAQPLNSHSANFKPPTSRNSRGSRRSRGSWRQRVPGIGNWHLVPWPERDDSLITADEQARDRARIVLDRYGVVFREILERETDGLRWRDVFRPLRLLELAGEVVSGCFFEGISGLQFASRAALKKLRHGRNKQHDFWLSAIDPACVSGLSLNLETPRRVPTSHIVYINGQIAMVSTRLGKSLDIRIPPEDATHELLYAPLQHLLHRRVAPHHRLVVEEINQTPALKSPYLPILREIFDVNPGASSITLFRHPSKT